MVVEYSDASMGKVAPSEPPALFKLPSASTMTQLLPDAPGVLVKLKPAKLVLFCICALVKPSPPAEVARPDVVVFQ